MSFMVVSELKDEIKISIIKTFLKFCSLFEQKDIETKSNGKYI